MLFCTMQREIKILLGWLITPVGLFCYMSIRKRKYYDIMVCDHIGDFVYTIGYLNTFKEINHIPHLRIVCTRRLLDVAWLYPKAADEYKVVSNKYLQLMLFPYRTSFGRLCYRHIKNIKIIEPSRDFVQQYEYVFAFPNLTLKDCIKYGILKLPEEAKMELPYLSNKVIKKDFQKINILLCPSAEVMDWKPYVKFFKRLSAVLQRSEINVFENKENMPLDEFVHFALQMDYVIGIRSGLLDLASLAGCPVIALYPAESKMMRYFDLQKMNENNTGIVQYRLSGDMKKDIGHLMNLIHK